MKYSILALTCLTVATGAVSSEVTLSEDINAKYWNALDHEGNVKPADQIKQRIDILVDAAAPYTDEERAKFRKKYKAKYADRIVIDGTAVGGIGSDGKGFPAMTAEQFDMLAIAGKEDYDVYSTTLSNGTDKTIEEIYDRVPATKKYLAEKHGQKHVTTVEEIEANKAVGVTSVIFNFQAITPMGEDITHIDRFSQDVKLMSFTYNKNNQFSGSGESVKGGVGNGEGLTKLGLAALKHMNKNGVVPDCSHDSNQTCIDIAKYSTTPVVASHSNAAALMPISRNINDEAILAIAKTDGLIGVNFVGGFLNKESDASGESVAEHIVYISDLIERELGVDGKRHVAVAVDYLHNLKDSLTMISSNPQNYPPALGYGSISEIGHPADIWAVVDALETTHGWTKDEVSLFLGENWMRVYAANWKGGNDVRIQPVVEDLRHLDTKKSN
ncbi:membrane dipeptidase [Vibrio crassostreae]|uniref:dipeptidase n=1 Tax=Vibrio sp. ZF 223 TaxID=2056191 RepID=UPI000D35E7B3|nr:membrane dipeptidase [Vibrio sp. ZF 223]PTQ05913.1 hypothetical protein CWO13_01105 [Vibrio sp. ZF 223]CAK3717635.1 membrane dipeptidase [Vibrio crassostreae]